MAERHCKAVLDRNPDHADINHLLGAIRFQQGNLEEALTHLKRATVWPGATAEYHNNLGCVLFKLGQRDGAIAAFERALALNPGFADALNNLGAIHREGSKSLKAVHTDLLENGFRPELLQAVPHLGAAYHGIVPHWHFAMMADRQRNEAS
jgi:Flp pilus assembly protein TadD